MVSAGPGAIAPPSEMLVDVSATGEPDEPIEPFALLDSV
jgi:hypothetical protein